MGACLLLACGACAPADKKGEEMEQPKITPLTERQNVSRALGGTDALGREISPRAKPTENWSASFTCCG